MATLVGTLKTLNNTALFVKPANEPQVMIQFYGTYVGATITVQGSADNIKFFNVPITSFDTSSLTIGTITPNSGQFYSIAVDGFAYIRFKLTAITSGSVAFGMQSTPFTLTPMPSASNGITATPSGSVSNSVQVTGTITRVTTVASSGDGICLPPSVAGLSLTITNAAVSNPMTVFAFGGATIDGTAGSAGYSHAAGKTVVYSCAAVGVWHKVISS